MNTITEKLVDRNDLMNGIRGFCKTFGLYELLRRFGAFKMRGVPVRQVFDFLFSLVFGGQNLYRTIVCKKSAEFSKDTVYRFLNNTKIHWERILALLAVAVISRLRALTSENRLTAIIVDDSPCWKDRSKKLELLTRQWDHAAKRYFMGFRMLTLAFTDGFSLIPFAFQMMSSVKATVKAKLFEDHTIAARRRKNAVKTMPDRLYALLKTAKALMIPAKHVLFDSWFSDPISLLKIHKIGYFCVSMLKKNRTRYLYDGNLVTITQLFKSLRKRPGKAKYLTSAIVTVIHKDVVFSIQAKIVFVRDKNNSKKWCAIISTDTKLSEMQIIELYGKRWDIEVFFKMCKSYLKLVKEFEGRSYDMLTAHTSIVFLRYICLVWTQRENKDPRTLGDLFFLCSDEVADISFAQAFSLIISILSSTLHDFLFLSDDQIDSFISVFIDRLPPQWRRLPLFSCES
jgi:hypothetical protein